MLTLKVIPIGSSLGVILSKEALALLRVGKDDKLFLTESPEGAKLSAFDPEFERQMQLGEQIMREDRDILRALAK